MRAPERSLDKFIIKYDKPVWPRHANDMPKRESAHTGGYMSEQEKEPILSRIERLEAENRRLKRGALAFVLVAASVGLMGQTTQRKRAPAPAPAPPPAPALPKNIEAESFVLKDAAGKARANLAMSGTGPAFKLLDAKGSALVTISMNDSAPGGPFVLLSDPQHHAGVTLSVLENAGSQLSLTGERPDVQAHMSVASDGPSLLISDQEGFSTSIGGAQVGRNGQMKKTSAASIALYNKDHKVLWSQP